MGTIIEQLLEKPLKSKDRDLFHLLLVGAYQLLHMKLPAYASINETVSACSLLGKNWAKGFINAVLRKVDRRKKDVGDSKLSKQNHPAWFVKKLKEQWEELYGEGTKFDLDYGKLVILGLCIYIAVQVS